MLVNIKKDKNIKQYVCYLYEEYNYYNYQHYFKTITMTIISYFI